MNEQATTTLQLSITYSMQRFLSLSPCVYVDSISKCVSIAKKKNTIEKSVSYILP